MPDVGLLKSRSIGAIGLGPNTLKIGYPKGLMKGCTVVTLRSATLDMKNMDMKPGSVKRKKITTRASKSASPTPKVPNTPKTNSQPRTAMVAAVVKILNIELKRFVSKYLHTITIANIGICPIPPKRKEKRTIEDIENVTSKVLSVESTEKKTSPLKKKGLGITATKKYTPIDKRVMIATNRNVF